MNKFIKISLAVLGALEVVFYIVSPIVLMSLVLLLSKSLAIGKFGLSLFYIVSIGATLFRAIKVGWLKGKDQDD